MHSTAELGVIHNGRPHRGERGRVWINADKSGQGGEGSSERGRPKRVAVYGTW